MTDINQEDHDIELHEDENEVMEAHDPKNAEAQSIVAVDKAGEATGSAPKRKGDNTKQDPMPKTKAALIAGMVGKMQGMNKADLSAMFKGEQVRYSYIAKGTNFVSHFSNPSFSSFRSSALTFDCSGCYNAVTGKEKNGRC